MDEERWLDYYYGDRSDRDEEGPDRNNDESERQDELERKAEREQEQEQWR